MIELVGFVVLLLGTVSRAEDITCSSECTTDPTNTTEPCNITSGECLFGCNQGFAGPNCSVKCPSNCSQHLKNSTEICDAATNECLHGCQSGYAGSTCSYACPENCYLQNNPKTESCNTSTGECLFGCQHGYAGPNCIAKCPSNCGKSEKLSTQTCNETSKMCLFGCLQGYGGQDCEYKCSSNCTQALTNDTETCDTSGKCLLGCMSGYAGHNCSFECPSNCWHSKENNTIMCYSTTGECLNGCRPGNAGPDCSYICPTKCRLSDLEGTEACDYKSGECFFGCMDGYAGPNCSYICPANCTISTEDGTDTCKYTTGECLLGCKDGYAGPNCSYPCPANCTISTAYGTDTCNYTTGECLLGCKNGYTGANCSLECPENCMFPSENETGTCHLTTKECLHGCNQGFAGPSCVVLCPQSCTSIDKNGAEICNSSTAECLFGCKDGFYGPNCTYACPDAVTNCKTCVSKQNNSGAICTECRRNFYQENRKCTSCNYFCLINATEPLPTCRVKDGYCEFGCRKGRYGNKCNFHCNNLCNGATCHRDTGRCLNGCTSTGYCGPTCGLVCQDGCVSQQCSQSCGCVKGCNTNHWGDKCQHLCGTNCNKPSNPNNAVCDSSNGTCLHGCTYNKYWGNKCDMTCSDGCVNGTCQQRTGNCTEGCTSYMLYGWRCDGECSTNCLGGTCDRVEQYCIEGCTNGNYGELCDKACNKNCINNICKRENGSCDNGCITGNYGELCDKKCSDKCWPLECERVGGNCTGGCVSGYHGFHCLNVVPITTPKPNGLLSDNWVYVAIGCGALVALGVMATIVLVTKKRRQIAKRRRTSRMSKIPDEKVLEETQRRQKRKAEGTGARLTQLFVENPLARLMKDRSHGRELITKVPLRDILGRVIKMDENDFSGEFDELKTGLTKSHEASRRIDNLALNFFVGIYPYDENRVILRHSFDEEDVKRKSKVRRGILKSVHFTTFGHSRDSTYEVLEAGRKESENANANGNQNDVNTKRRNKGGKDRYSSVVFDIKDETGDEEQPKKEKKGVNDYAIVDISGSGKTSLSGTDAEPSDYAKVTYGDKTKPPIEDGLDDNYDHINRDKNGGTAQTEQANNDDETCEYSVVHKDKDGSHDHIGGNESGESTQTDQPKDADQCNYAVVHKEKKGQGKLDITDEEDVRKRMPEVTKEKDGSITIKKDYINASLIKGYNQNEKYIAAQAPSKVTANDFWIMAWEQKSSFIVMLTEILEEGLSRCEKYWSELDNQETYGDITVTCYDFKQYADYTVRLLRLSLKNGHEKEIVHLQFTAWPEEGCPVSAIDFIQFHQKYRSLTKGRLGMGPTIVHCTAGVGRTGVFIALDILVEEGLDSLSVDVHKCVVALREQRVDMVRSIDQYEFLYKAVAQTFALEAQPCHKVRLQDKLTELKRFDHDSGKSKMELLYQSLKASLVLDTAEIATVDVLQERRSKDRPTSDVPDVLFRPDLPKNIYINAVIFESLRKKEAIVATQMPTPDTLQDFCQLLVYHQCATVIMLNPIDPNDKSIGTYWPTAKTPVVAGKMIVSQLSIEKESDYIIRQLRIHTPETNDDDTPAHEVTMIQYKGWKIVKNVPNAKNMLKLLQVCRRYIEDLPDKRLLIHCMNGAEQSGLFCALVNLLEIADIEDEISVTSVVRKILARRPNALPSVDQFEMCFAATCEYIKKA